MVVRKQRKCHSQALVGEWGHAHQWFLGSAKHLDSQRCQETQPIGRTASHICSSVGAITALNTVVARLEAVLLSTLGDNSGAKE